MQKSKEVIIWMDSPLSNGHVSVVALLGKSLIERGVKVILATGKDTMPRLKDPIFRQFHEIVELPTMDKEKYPKDFQKEPSPEFAKELEAIESQRSKALTDLADRYKDAAIVLELWPTGREFYNKEVLALVEHVTANRKNPLIYSLARDDKPYQTPEFVAEMTKRFLTGGLLIRADGDIMKLPPEYSCLIPEKKIKYVGCMTSEMPSCNVPDEERGFLINNGGSIQEGSKEMFKAALRAIPKTGLNFPVTIVIGEKEGHHACGAFIEELELFAKQIGIQRIRFLKDLGPQEFRQEIANAKLFITHLGYNNAMEAIRAGVPIVGVPVVRMLKEGCCDAEQVLRGALLSSDRYQYAQMVSADDAKRVANFEDGPEVFVNAIVKAWEQRERKTATQSISFEGAENAARIIDGGIRTKHLADESAPTPNWSQFITGEARGTPSLEPVRY